MRLQAKRDIPREAAARILTTYAERYPQALPAVVRALEQRAGRGRNLAGLGAAEEEAGETTRTWWQRGLDAVTSLGATAIEVIGKQKLSSYMDKSDAKSAEAQYALELENAKREAAVATRQAENAVAAAEYQRQLAEIQAAETATKLSTYMPYVLGGLALVAVWALAPRAK